MVELDLKANQIWIYDSCVNGYSDREIYAEVQLIKKILLKWLAQNGFYNDQTEIDSTKSWKMTSIKEGILQQNTGSSDCGVFMLIFILSRIYNQLPKFDSEHEKFFRKKICFELVSNQII